MLKNKSRKKARKQKIAAKKIAPIKLPIKKILYFTITFALILSAFLSLRNSPYFKLSDIKIIDSQGTSGLKAGELLGLYKGRNIFTMDINSIASRIKSEHSGIKQVYVKRMLPDTLEIDVIPRVPIAVLKSHELFPIDRSGMVLSPEVKNEGLPVITGLSFWLKPRSGQKTESQRVESAFRLIDALKEVCLPKSYKVTEINAANHKNLSFYFENGIEVKIGGEDFPERLKMLKTTLARRALDKGTIKYIDLRFTDVVIGPK